MFLLTPSPLPMLTYQCQKGLEIPIPIPYPFPIPQSQIPAFREKQDEGKLDNETAFAEGRSLEMMGDAGVALIIIAGVATLSGTLLILLPRSPPPRRPRPKAALAPPATSAHLLRHP